MCNNQASAGIELQWTVTLGAKWSGADQKEKDLGQQNPRGKFFLEDQKWLPEERVLEPGF